MENFFDISKIFKMLWKWKIGLTVVVIVALAASVLISSPLFIKPKYKSTARLYPVNIAEYSEESESEQLLEFLNSTDIKFKLIEEMKLDEVYRINKQDPLYQSYILTELAENLSLKKTEYETIEIRVLDESPQRAADMVDSLISFLNQKIQSVHSYKYWEVANIAKQDINRQQNIIDSIKTEMQNIRQEYGILDYDLQVEAASEGLYKSNSAKAEKLLSGIKEKGGEYKYLQNRLAHREMMLDSIQVEYDWALSNAQKKVTYSLVVEHPFISDKKAYPVRWLIVVLSAFGAFIFGALTVLVIEFTRERSIH